MPSGASFLTDAGDTLSPTEPTTGAAGHVKTPDQVLRLVERFETQVRREFIDPFFKALGWDVDNEAGYAQQYKDVVHEDAIKIGLDARAPDYSFRIRGC
jgi:hypothetical protein